MAERTESSSKIAGKPPQKGLKSKLIRVMILVGALPLILAMIISYIQGNKSIRKVIGSSFKALAYETSTKIDFILAEEIARNVRLATHPTLVLSVSEHSRYLKNLGADEASAYLSSQENLWNREGPEESRLPSNAGSRILSGFLKNNSVSNRSTKALFVTDANGALVSSINSYPDYLNVSHPFWKIPISGGRDFVYIGELYKDDKLDNFVFHIAIPILRNGEKSGVFHRVFSAKELFSSSIESIIFGETGHVMMINSKGVVIDCPILPTGFQLADPELVKAVTGPEASWSQTRGNGHDGSEELSIIGFSPLLMTNEIIRASASPEWYTFAWQASDELFAPTQNLFLWISSAGVLSLLLIIVMGSVASDRVVKPIRNLQIAAARIGRGENVEPLNIATGDEIESLAGEINSMNRMLQKSFSGLENQVREKSQEVLYLKEYTDSILMSVPDVLLIFNEKHHIEYINASFERLTNIPGREVIGKSLREVSPDFEESWDTLETALSDYSQDRESKNDPAKREGASQNYKAQDPLAQKNKDQAEDSKTVLKFKDRFFAYQFFDVAIMEAETQRIGLLMKEVTEEKLLQDQLAMAEKLSGLGTLAAGIAHEMNNPLYSIMGYTEAILEEKDSGKIKTFAQKVLDRAKHMAAIILSLSGYSKSSFSDGSGKVDINEKLDAALDIAILASYTDDIQLTKNYGTLPAVQAKPDEIQQVFTHIIRNAVQAMEGKGRLTITSQQVGGNIVVEIQDSGPGIAPEFLSKIFDPFFTTKDQGEGTGLGLNIAHKVIEKYGGHIEVDSQVGKGSTFSIKLPGNSN